MLLLDESGPALEAARQLAAPAGAGPVTAVLLKGWQADGGSAGVEVGGVLDWPGHSVSVFYFGDLGPKDLFAAFVHADPVGQVRQVALSCVLAADCVRERLERLALKVELPVGVLSDQPRVMGTVFSHQRSTRPSVLRDDLAQPGGVRDIDSLPLHPRSRIDANDELAFSSWRRLADPLILRGHPCQFGRQDVIHSKTVTRPRQHGKKATLDARRSSFSTTAGGQAFATARAQKLWELCTAGNPGARDVPNAHLLRKP